MAVRTAAGLPNDLVGVALMREAFNPHTGKLTDKESVVAEREAMSALFAGAIGHRRNPGAPENDLGASGAACRRRSDGAFTDPMGSRVARG